MGKRKITIKRSAAQSIAKVAWYIESKGMLATADKFSDATYDFIEALADKRKSSRNCRDQKRALLGLKCVTYQKKYSVIFIETPSEITICEFVPSKLIRW